MLANLVSLPSFDNNFEDPNLIAADAAGRSGPMKRGLPSRELPLNLLQPFAKVEQAFASLGVGFEDAIAIVPSNENFIDNESAAAGTPPVVLMPMAGSYAIRLNLLQPMEQIKVKIRGYSDMRLTTLNGSGISSLSSKIAYHRYADKQKAPTETITIDLRGAQTLCIKSGGPFILESVAI